MSEPPVPPPPAPSEKKKGTPPPEPELLVTILSCGMTGGQLNETIESLKDKSKSIGTHKRRELYWQAYTALGAKTSSMDGATNCLLLYRGAEDGEKGEAEVLDLTKRQRGLVGGGCEFLGHKFKPLLDGKPDPTAKGWCMCFSEADAQLALDDLMDGEPCVYTTADGVFVATRFKRALCKGLSAPLKALKDVEALVAELKPDAPLKSLSFTANAPPTINGYNVFLTGPTKLDKELPPTIGQVNTTSTAEMYDYFLQRRNAHLVGEAGKLIDQMLADVSKGLTPLVVAGSQKECVVAYKNALMKKVYVHESSKKFIDRVRKDGQVEMCVITGDVEKSTFGQYGKLVFELFYRCDLSTMM